jgi:hypothetical protein
MEITPQMFKPFINISTSLPQFNIFGLVGKALHAKAALVGTVVGAKATLLAHLLGSSSGPVIGD